MIRLIPPWYNFENDLWNISTLRSFAENLLKFEHTVSKGVGVLESVSPVDFFVSGLKRMKRSCIIVPCDQNNMFEQT